MLSKDDFLTKMGAIGTCEDDAERRNLLIEVQAEIGNVYDENARLTESNAKFEADNKKLQEYNMQLFLNVGRPSKNSTGDGKPDGDDTDNLRYENLFNEKGEIK